METRDTLKKVINFANWEFKEKRLKLVKVFRVKAKRVISSGVLPELRMRTVGNYKSCYL